MENAENGKEKGYDTERKWETKWKQEKKVVNNKVKMETNIMRKEGKELQVKWETGTEQDERGKRGNAKKKQREISDMRKR